MFVTFSNIKLFNNDSPQASLFKSRNINNPKPGTDNATEVQLFPNLTKVSIPFEEVEKLLSFQNFFCDSRVSCLK